MRLFARKILLLLFVGFAFSCQKEAGASLEAKPSCSLVATYLYQEGKLADSIRYFLEAGKVSKIELGNHSYYTISYDGDHVVRRDYFNRRTGERAGYEVISYNRDGEVEKIDEYKNLAGHFMLWWTYRFSYLDGKLQNLSEWADGTLRSEFTYKWNSKNIIRTDLERDGKKYHYKWKHEGRKNRNTPTLQHLLVDGVLRNEIGFFIPICLSENNVTGGTDQEEANLNFEYKEDQFGNTSEVWVGKELWQKHRYYCP